MRIHLITFYFSQLQLLTVCLSVLEGKVGGRSTVMQPSDHIGDRPLTALVLHTVTVILSRRNALLEPFVNILVNPSLMKVNSSDYVFISYSNQYECVFYCIAKGEISTCNA